MSPSNLHLAAPLGSSLAGWTFTEEDLSKAVAGELLINPSIDLGNPCNLNCLYCFVEEKGSTRKARKYGELTLAETFAVIDDFASAGARTINIVGAGEPLLDPCLEPVLNHILGLDLSVVIFTNGARIASDGANLMDLLSRRGVTIVIKVNSFDSLLQDSVAGYRGYSVLRDRALGILIDAGFSKGSPTHLGVDTLVFKGNLEELPSIHRWCRDHNIFPISAEFIPTGRTANGVTDDVAAYDTVESDLARVARYALRPIDAADRHWLSREISAIDNELGIEAGRHRAYFGGGKCTQILGVYVDILGDIWPCVARSQLINGIRSPTRLGSIRQGDKASRVWVESSYMRSLRSHFNGSCPYRADPGCHST